MTLGATPRNGRRTVITGDMLSLRPGLRNCPTRWAYTPNPHFPDLMEPALDVVLIGPQGRGWVRGIIDSGANATAIPRELAAQIGVDLSHATTKTAYGNDSMSDVLYPAEPVSLIVAGRTIELPNVVFGGWVEILLGRDDVFSHFRVLIDERAQEFVLEPYDDEQEPTSCR